MANISASQKKNLNRMNRASKDVLLGDIVSNLQANATVSGSHVVTTAEATASKVIIATGLSTVKGFVGQDLRSGSPIVNAKWVSGSVAGTVVVSNSTSGSPLANGDILTYIAF